MKNIIFSIPPRSRQLDQHDGNNKFGFEVTVTELEEFAAHYCQEKSMFLIVSFGETFSDADANITGIA